MENTQDSRNERLDIERFQSFGIDNAQIINNHNRKIWKRRNSSISGIAGKKRYESSEKGKLARKKAMQRRMERMKEASKELTDEEKNEIEEFYQKKPFGMHVDHIIPISKRGKHCLSNLQYVPPKENYEKAARTDYYEPFI